MYAVLRTVLLSGWFNSSDTGKYVIICQTITTLKLLL